MKTSPIAFLLLAIALGTSQLLTACDGAPTAANASAAPERTENAVVAAPTAPPANAQAPAEANASEPAPAALPPEAPDTPPPRRAMTDPVEPVETVDDAAAPVRPFPDQVTRFMVQRDGCDHFLGEEPYDEARRTYLDQSVRELCTGTDRRLKRLRKLYAKNPDVVAALEKYEDVELTPEN